MYDPRCGHPGRLPTYSDADFVGCGLAISGAGRRTSRSPVGLGVIRASLGSSVGMRRAEGRAPDPRDRGSRSPPRLSRHSSASRSDVRCCSAPPAFACAPLILVSIAAFPLVIPCALLLRRVREGADLGTPAYPASTRTRPRRLRRFPLLRRAVDPHHADEPVHLQLRGRSRGRRLLHRTHTRCCASRSSPPTSSPPCVLAWLSPAHGSAWR